MFRTLRSLRFRLVMTFVLVVGAITAALAGAAVMVRDWQVRTRFDQRLTQQTERIGGWLQSRLAEGDAGESVSAALNHADRPFADEDLYLTLHTIDGGTAAQSASIGAGRLPPAADAASGFATRSGDEVAGLRGRPKRVRTFERVVTSGGESYVLCVGASLAEVDESLAAMAALLWVALPTAFIVAGFAGWIVIGDALRTIHTVARTARHITPEHLDERIDVVAGDTEINRLVTDLNHMLDRLSTSFKAQQRFITQASHTLQTPVAALLSQAQVLKGSASDEDCRKFVTSVEEEMRQLKRMLAGMLSLIRVESGELERSQSVLSMNDVMVAAVDAAGLSAEAKGVRIHLRLPEPDEAREPEVVGDAGLLQTMVENLVRHAVRYAPDGSTVEAELELDDDQAIVTVSDTGASLSDAGLRNLFGRAGDAEGEQRDRQSDGPAMAMAKTIAELHDGTLGVRNRRGGGVASFVWLPLAARGG